MRQGVHPSLLQSFFSRSEQPRGVPMNSMRLRTAEFQLVLHAGRPRVRSPGGRVCPNFKCGAGLNGPVNNSIKGREGNLAVSLRCVGAGTRLKQFPPRTRENKVCTVHWTDTTARDVLVPTHKFKALWTPTPNKVKTVLVYVRLPVGFFFVVCTSSDILLLIMWLVWLEKVFPLQFFIKY